MKNLSLKNKLKWGLEALKTWGMLRPQHTLITSVIACIGQLNIVLGDATKKSQWIPYQQTVVKKSIYDGFFYLQCNNMVWSFEDLIALFPQPSIASRIYYGVVKLPEDEAFLENFKIFFFSHAHEVELWPWELNPRVNLGCGDLNLLWSKCSSW